MLNYPGDLYPKQITQLASYWGEYLVGRVENELVFTQEEEWDDEADLSLESLDIQLQGTFKNTDLLKTILAFFTVQQC